jgi:hypothetical protein
MFIAFNVMMAIMVYMSMGHTEESNTAVQVGAGMGIGMLGMMWAAGVCSTRCFYLFYKS